MANPLVSIIIPVHNAGKFLPETISSALAQTWEHKEVIVVDNLSTDNSLEIAHSFGTQVKVYQQNIVGASATRNKGLFEAKGEYIQFLDADDLLKNDKIALQLNAIKDTPGTIAYGNYASFFDGEDINPELADSYIQSDYNSGIELLYNLYGGNDPNRTGSMVPQHSWLAPRSVIDKAGCWNTNLTVDDDGEFFCRVLLKSEGVKYVPDAVCYYRKHKGQENLSAQKSYQAWVSAFEAIMLKQQYIGDNNRLNKLLANQAIHLLCDLYPQYPELCKQMQQFIDKMGGNTWWPYQEGPHKVFRMLFGWRMVRYLSYYKNLQGK